MKNKCNKSKDEYLELLKHDFTNEEVKKRYDEIAEKLRDQLKRIYLDYIEIKLFSISFLIIIVFLLNIILFFVFKISISFNEETIQNVTSSIFTAFIAFLGLLSVFFVFKIDSQRKRIHNGINKMCDLIKEKYDEKSPQYQYINEKRAKYSTKELLYDFKKQCYFYKIPGMRESWIYTLNQLYISHVIRDYFVCNLYLFTSVIILSLMLMIGFPYIIPLFNRETWNTFWFVFDIELVLISIVYVFHTLMVMVRHIYKKEDLKKIHYSERGIGLFK